MTFILAADGRDQDVVGAFRRYRDYLLRMKDRFPPSAYALATSDWYFNFADHRCPHDAWLETCNLTEPSFGMRHENRSLTLFVTLLGAYHDGHIELRYPIVISYEFELIDSSRWHRDWRYDELRLSARGTLLHEIEWRGADSAGSWLIEASDLEYTWIPKSP